MLHNDISNRQAPIIAFNVDNLLFEDVETSNKLVNIIKHKMLSNKSLYLNRKVNQSMVNRINHIWNLYDYSIYFITFHPEYIQELYEVLDKCNVNYTSLIPESSWEALREVCDLQYTYYVDNDASLLSYIGTKSLHIDELSKIIK